MENSTKAECDVANNEIESRDIEGAVTSVQEELPVSSGQMTSPALFIGPLANPNLAVETRYMPRDVKDPMAVNGSCGLYNLGNTCFMSAGLQSLASCPPLLKHFFEEFALTEGLRGTLTGAFYQLLVKMWSGRYSLVQPRHFKELLGLYHPQFQDYRQHDCQEFLALLLDTFHEQLNRTSPDHHPYFTTPTTPQPHTDTTTTTTTTPSADSAGGGQGHLNNEDQGEAGATSASGGKGEKRECSASVTSDTGFKLLCPETLSSEEELGGAGGDVLPPRSSQGQSSLLAADPPVAQGRSSLKRISSSSTEAVMAALFSEDSNHSTLSAHSTDSEQSNAFKKLKIEAEGGGNASVVGAATTTTTTTATTTTTTSSASVLSSVSEMSGQESSGCAEAQSSAAAGCKGAAGSDNNNSAESGAESMEMSPPANSSIPQRKCVRIDIPSTSSQVNTSFSSDQTLSKVNKEQQQLPDAESSGGESVVEKLDSADNAKTEGEGTFFVGLKKFNNTELPASSSSAGGVSPEGVMSSAGQPCSQHDNPAMSSSPQDPSRSNPLHFYCKETKTLNTNVLVSNFVQGDVSTDSEKFAKVDNRSQVPVTKEVNLLHEALQGLEEDKVEKALIGKSLGGGTAPNHLMMMSSSSSTMADDDNNSEGGQEKLQQQRKKRKKEAGGTAGGRRGAATATCAWSRPS